MYKLYGLYSPFQIPLMIEFVTLILGGDDNVKALIKETIASETNNGRTNYNPDRGFGYGLGQFDRIAFDDVIARTNKSTKAKVLKYFFIDLDTITYEDLRTRALLSIIMIRLKYKLIPQRVPDNMNHRYDYYKKYYNSYQGKATLEHYLSANQ